MDSHADIDSINIVEKDHISLCMVDRSGEETISQVELKILEI